MPAGMLSQSTAPIATSSAALPSPIAPNHCNIVEASPISPPFQATFSWVSSPADQRFDRVDDETLQSDDGKRAIITQRVKSGNADWMEINRPSGKQGQGAGTDRSQKANSKQNQASNLNPS